MPTQTTKHTKKIQVELTSAQDSAWTWRKLGAKEPKGEILKSLLPETVTLGDELWLEVSINVDGVFVESVIPVVEKTSRKGTEILEMKSANKFNPVVVGNQKSKPQRNEKNQKKRRPKARIRKPRPEMPDSQVEKKPKGPKLNPKSEHRNKWLKALSEEDKPVASLLIKGGMPAVRKAIAEDEKIKSSKNLIELAQKLSRKSRLMEWKDRAAAALIQVETLRLEDLRSVVAASESFIRDAEVATLASTLKEKLMERLEKEQGDWLKDINTLLEEGRIIRALALSGRPPKAGSPLPKEVYNQLIIKTNEVLTSEVHDRRWVSFLKAISRAPVAQHIAPASYPAKPSEELIALAKSNKKYIPIIAKNLLATEPTNQIS